MTTLAIHNLIRQQDSQKQKETFFVFYQRVGVHKKINNEYLEC